MGSGGSKIRRALRYALYQEGVPVQGYVVGTQRQENRSKDKDGRWETSFSYHPVIEFAIAGGVKHQFTGDIPKGLSKYGAIGSTMPGGVTHERFEAAPISFDPGPAIVGKSVEICVHREDKARYQVNLEPVLAELQRAKPWLRGRAA